MLYNLRFLFNRFFIDKLSSEERRVEQTERGIVMSKHTVNTVLTTNIFQSIIAI